MFYDTHLSLKLFIMSFMVWFISWSELQRSERCVRTKVSDCSVGTQRFFMDQVKSLQAMTFERCVDAPKLPEEPSCSIDAAKECVTAFTANLGVSVFTDELCV